MSLDYRRPRTLIVTIAFIVAVVLVGQLIGLSAAPDAWYTALEKPPFNPPNWLLPPVWITLYVLIAIAGARTFLRNPISPAMALWVGQMLLNWVWTPVWFGLHQLWPAFAILLAMFACIIGFIAVSWSRDRAAALMFVPYALCVMFAGSLNLSIAILN